MPPAATRLFACLVVSLACASSARAQPSPPTWDGTVAPRVYARGGVGAFGDVRALRGEQRVSAPVAASAGGAIGVEIPLAHAFSIGADVGVWSWSASQPARVRVTDSLAVDVSLVPRFRTPWELPTGQHFAVALALPVGPTVSFLRLGENDDALTALGVREGRGVGMHAGALVEIEAFVTPHLGVIVDGGYLHHFLWHPATSAGTPIAIDFGQAVVRAGVVVAF